MSIPPQLIYILINEFNSFIFGGITDTFGILSPGFLIGAGSTCELPGYWQCSIYGPGWCYINRKAACVSSLYPYHYQRFTSLLTPDDTILSLRDTQ